MNRLVLSVKEAADACGVSVWTFRRWLAEGVLPVVQFPSTARRGEANRRVLISVDDLKAFRDRHRVGVNSVTTAAPVAGVTSHRKAGHV